MSYILGVDGGGSKTLAVVADETGQVLGIGRAGSANHQVLGLAPAMHHIATAARDACTRGGIDSDEVEVAAYCIAGADLPEDFAAMRPALQELRLAREIHLDNDIVAALYSGSNRIDVVVVGWGSGVNAFGRNAAGMEIRLPALGWISGDWGGGGDLGREAIHLVVRADDGRGRPTHLREPVLAAFEVPDVDSLIRKLYIGGADVLPTHALAPLVFAVAERGDIVAQHLVERAGIEIATTAVALMQRLGLLAVPCDVVLAGSIFKSESPLLLSAVRAGIHAIAPQARITQPDIEPVVGALLRGFDVAGLVPDAAKRATAKASYERLIQAGTVEVDGA